MPPRLPPIRRLLRRGSAPILTMVVPLGSFVVMLLTVAVCYRVWSVLGKRPAGVIFPAISELGIDLPERRIYQVGFAVCGALLSLGVCFFQELMEPHLVPKHTTGDTLVAGVQARVRNLAEPQGLNGQHVTLQSQDEPGGYWRVALCNGAKVAVPAQHLVLVGPGEDSPEQKLWNQCLAWAHASAAGVVVQGVFTLRREMGAQCFVHWGGAILFILGARQHGQASVDLYEAALSRKTPLLSDSGVGSAIGIRRWLLNHSSIFLFLVPLVCQLILPSIDAESARASAKDAVGDPSPRILNAMGMTQWGIILQFAVFFSTYALDMSAAVSCRPATD